MHQQVLYTVYVCIVFWETFSSAVERTEDSLELCLSCQMGRVVLLTGLFQFPVCFGVRALAEHGTVMVKTCEN